jgi:hypothetical protein
MSTIVNGLERIDTPKILTLAVVAKAEESTGHCFDMSPQTGGVFKIKTLNPELYLEHVRCADCGASLTGDPRLVHRPGYIPHCSVYYCTSIRGRLASLLTDYPVERIRATLEEMSNGAQF